ncbi:MAG: hydroxymethylglutaryl-CoA reductase [Lactobacillus sp.]|nr:hydroxymethylglutaryl-CoA reductase [Lactobacillus sp.]
MKFYELSPDERRKQLGLSAKENLADVDALSENVIGKLTLPLSVIPDFEVNGKSYCLPLSTEEPSVVAAINKANSIFKKHGKLTASANRTGIWGQIFVQKPAKKLDLNGYISVANEHFESLVKHGGGVRKLEQTEVLDLLCIKVLVDPSEAMGANYTNSILEFLKDRICEDFDLIGYYAILSNYPSQMTHAQVQLPVEVLGQKACERLVLLSKIAEVDPYRMATHVKGIMNGVDAALIATGNDYRAVEAAVSRLSSLAKWKIVADNLVGEIDLPMPIGVVGGSISARQDVKEAYHLLGKINADTLAELITAAGLCSNFSALLAISTTGIQAGHMKLQIKNVLQNLDANNEEKQLVKDMMLAKKQYTETSARNFLKEVRKNDSRN